MRNGRARLAVCVYCVREDCRECLVWADLSMGHNVCTYEHAKCRPISNI